MKTSKVIATIASFLAVLPAFAQTAAQMGMTEEEHAHMHDLPKGTGASADGGAWLVPDVSGVYILHNGTILGITTNAVRLEAGKPYRVMPHKGPLIWTPPGGVQGPVPKANLIAIAKTYPATP